MPPRPTQSVLDQANQIYQNQYNGGQDMPTPTHSGNFLTHLLPTAGGILGGIVGIPGDFLGGAGSIAGAAGGSALGKTLENSLEGKQALQGSDLTAGAEGAIGGAGGAIAGKILGKGAGLLGDAAENMASKTASDTAAKDAIDQTATAYKDVSPQLQKLYNAKDSLAHVANMGFDATNPENLSTVANTTNDILNEHLNKALASSGSVDLSHYPQIIKDALADEGGTLGSFDKIALSRGRLGQASTQSAKLLSQLEDLGAGVAKTNSDPNEIRTLTTKLGQLAQDAKPGVSLKTGAIDPEQRAVYNVINNVRDNVKSALYDRPEVNDALKGAIANIAPEDVGSKELADHLNTVIGSAGKSANPAQDVLKEISRNINIDRLGQEGSKVGQIVTSTGGQARAAAEAGLSPEEGGGTILDPFSHMASGNHGNALGSVIKGATHVAKNPAILSTLSRAGQLISRGAPAAGVLAATSPNLAADPVAPVGGNDTMQPNGADNAMNPNPLTDPSQQDVIDAARRQAILMPGLAGSNGNSGALSFLSSMQPTLQHNQAAETAAQGLPAALGNAGGAQGLSGILSRISGLIPGTAAHTYAGERQAVAAQLAQTLGITPQAAEALLPQIMQSQGVAGQQQGVLSQLTGQLAH